MCVHNPHHLIFQMAGKTAFKCVGAILTPSFQIEFRNVFLKNAKKLKRSFDFDWQRIAAFHRTQKFARKCSEKDGRLAKKTQYYEGFSVSFFDAIFDFVFLCFDFSLPYHFHTSFTTKIHTHTYTHTFPHL